MFLERFQSHQNLTMAFEVQVALLYLPGAGCL